MAWLIWRIEPSKEQKVAAAIQDLFEVYLPMEMRSYRHSRQRRRAVKEIPLLPRLLFVRHPFVEGLQDIIGHKYVLGFVRDPTRDPTDATRPPYIIQDCQMAIFQGIVSGWRLEALQAHARQTLKKVKRVKMNSFEELKLYFDGLAKLEETS